MQGNVLKKPLKSLENQKIFLKRTVCSSVNVRQGKYSTVNCNDFFEMSDGWTYKFLLNVYFFFF